MSLFGALSAQSGFRQLGPSSFGGVKPKALLEILLLARGHLVSKDTLAEALWPETLPKNVAGTLETYVSVLRRHMFDDRAQARRVIVTASGAYRVALDEVSVDLDRFDELLLQAERAGHHERRALWIEAVALATGDLLEDEPFAPWVEVERDRYRRRVARVHLLIAEDSLAAADFGVALRHAETALLANPFADEAFRAVMLAHHGLGHGETSRQTFARCREVLGRELGLDPATETVDLAGAIDAGTPASELIVPVRRDAGPSPATERRERRDPARRMPFLGRAAELARLEAHVERCRSGRFGLILLEGRPGLGRTAMLDQLQGSLHGTVGRASYSTRDAELPSLPLAEALQNALASSVGAADAEAYANAPWLSGGDALESLYEVIERHGPMVLLLDDLHWADPTTLEAIEWLHWRAPQLPLAIIATLRSSETVHSSPFDALNAADRLCLRGLDPSDTAGLDDDDQAMIRATGGNPRLMADIWRWQQAGRDGWPPSLHQAVKRRVRGLGGRTSGLLQKAALLPEPFALPDVVGELDIRERATATELRRLCDIEVLEEVTGGFRFVEPVVREVLARTVTPERQVPQTTPSVGRATAESAA